MKVKCTIDPLNKHSNVQEENLIRTFGFIPQWALNSEFEDKPLKEALDIQYGFGLYELTDTKIKDDGTWKYPGDPDLFPILKLKRGNETLYQYNYGLVAIVQEDGSSFCTRMD